MLVSKAQLYYIAPFKICNYDLFVDYLKEESWKSPDEYGDYDRHSINAANAEFLGLRPGGDTGVLQGECFSHEDVSGIYNIFNNKKTVVQGRTVGSAEAFLMNYLRIHLCKDSSVGLLVFGLSVGEMEVDTLIKLNYDLHKIDSYQSPTLLFKKSRTEYEKQPGFDTMGALVRRLLGCNDSDNVMLLNQHRLRAAACLHIDTNQKSYDEAALNDALVLMSMCYSVSYKLPVEKKISPEYLFDNIAVSAFFEGISMAVFRDFSKGEDNFEANFEEKFRYSYMTIYLMANLAESIIATNSNKENLENEEMIKVLHKVKCFTKLPVSQYHHLVRFSEICNNAIYLPQRNDALVDYFEYERVDRENHLAELEKIRGEEAKVREQNLNYIMLLFTFVQFFFLVLNFSGVNTFCDLDICWLWVVISLLIAISYGFIRLVVKVLLRRK